MRRWIVALLTILIVVAVLYLSVRCAYSYLGEDELKTRVTALATLGSMVVSLLTLVVVIGAAVAAFAQLSATRKDRDAQLTLEIFKSYIENSELFKIRGLVHKYKTQLNASLTEVTADEAGREILNDNLKTVTARQLDVSLRD